MREFINKMFTSKSGVSSKRVAGFIILIAELIIIAVCTFFAIPITINLLSLHNTLLYIGGTMLGVGLLEKAGNLLNIKKDAKS